MATRRSKRPPKVTRTEAEKAVRTLLAFIGEDPDRAGLRRTPTRVLGSFEDWYSGYATDPHALLGNSFQKVDRFDRIVTLTHIDFESHCEHHMAPMLGQVHLAYLPNQRLAGISKLVRVVEAYTRRLQVQERLTAEIARCLHEVLEPRGVAVIVEAQHQCMTTRGVRRPNVKMVTSEMLGVFDEDDRIREEFLALVHQNRP